MKNLPTPRLVALAATGLAALLLVTGCGGSGSAHGSHVVPLPPAEGDHQEVRAANLDYAWPFKVSHGTIACHPVPKGPLLLFTDPGGRTWALNRLAEENGYPAVKPIGNGFSLGVIIGDAFRLCPKGNRSV